MSENNIERAMSDIGYQLEKSAADMVRSSTGAVSDGDSSGGARALCIAAREYEWAARIWAALGQLARVRHCRDLAAGLMAGDVSDEP